MKGILGKKVGMTQIFDEKGRVIPVTVIEAGPCVVTQVRNVETDGYAAVQLGFDEVKPRRISKPELGHLKKNSIAPLRHLREFRIDAGEQFELGQQVDVSLFTTGDLVDISGTSKGKGFAGAIKRHHFSRQKATHGQSDRERAPGSLGAGTTPGRVFKGKRMPGHMGDERVTVQNLEVVLVDPERNLLAIKGAVPGAKDGLLMICESVKVRERAAAKAAKGGK